MRRDRPLYADKNCAIPCPGLNLRLTISSIDFCSKNAPIEFNPMGMGPLLQSVLVVTSTHINIFCILEHCSNKWYIVDIAGAAESPLPKKQDLKTLPHA
jgi:hypothetical protein